jgi:hypothetical protein
MGAYRRASAATAGVLALALMTIGIGASTRDSAAAASVRRASAPLVSFVRPTGDTLVQKGTGPIRVIVHLGAGARLTKVDIDGVDVTRLLRPRPGGDYGALLRFSAHLHYGYNDAFAQATGSNGARGSDHVRFIVAQRNDSLLRLTSFSTQTPAAPIEVDLREQPATHVSAVLSTAQGVSARVYINDRRVDRGFVLQGRRLIVHLGASQRLHFGRNLIQILVHKTHPYKHQSSYDIESRTLVIARNAPIASAGADQTTTVGELVQLDGQASKLPPGLTKPVFRWRIVGAPKGSTARLRSASGSFPTLAPDRAGVYEVRVSVRARRPAPASGTGARDAVASSGSSTLTGVSNDTATVTVKPAIPPFGVKLETLVLNQEDSVRLGGSEVAATPFSFNRINYVVLDRRTLRVAQSGSVEAGVAGMKDLAATIDGYAGSLNYLVVLNWNWFTGDIDADRNAFDALLQQIGAQKLTDQERQEIRTHVYARGESGSAVGVAGAPAGSAFVKLSGPDQDTVLGGMSGYLRLNGVTEKYDFVFTDAADFDTETNQTSTDDSPAQLTVKVGDRTYTKPNPGGGASGFHLVVLSAKSLADYDDGVYATNSASGAEQTGEVERLAGDLVFAAYSPTRPLVFLQAFGAPHGNDAAWDLVARLVERLGGTRQVFDAMNAADPRALNGEDPKRKGPYAFVGRAGSTAPLAEASYSLNGDPGRLAGVLMRGHDGGYEPMLAGPPDREGESAVNTELIQIADQPPQPASFPAFKDTNGNPIDAASAEAVQKFLGGPTITGLCAPGPSECDIRKSYYESYTDNWASVQNDLSNATEHKCSGSHEGFTESQCQGIASQLRDEVSMVAKVQQYFGPLGLQRPFGAAGATALANLNSISQEVKEAVEPPENKNTTSSALEVLSEVVHLGGALAGGEKVERIASILGPALGLTAYFTESDGEQNLIGPQITTTASKLGVELTARYNAAGSNLDDLGRLIVSDYRKLTEVAGKINRPPVGAEPDWRLGNIGIATNELTEAAKRTIYERLLPLAYPNMYQLAGWANARDWWCYVPWPYPDRYLFRKQDDGAQFVGRYPDAMTVAVAKASYLGSGGDAYVPGIPDTITNELFKPLAAGGLGLNKLEFYSPRNGFRYVSLNGLRQASGIAPFCAEVPDPPGNGH